MTTDGVPGPEPELAAAIAAAVGASRTRRLQLPAVLSAAAAVDRTAAASVGWRARVLAALQSLRAGGVIDWPTTRFDTSASPHLPLYVTRPAAVSEPAVAEVSPVWHHELAWAAVAMELGALSSAERRALIAVNEWIPKRTTLVVPMRERSLEVFGDEKVLESLVLGPLFGPGRLTLAGLACEACWPPVEQTVLGTGDDWLLVENYTTYVSISRRAAQIGFDGRIVWASGNQVGTRLATLALADLVPKQAWYFGDIDAGGFRVARSAVTRASELGLGELTPARPLYRLAVEHGARRPTDTAPARAEALAWIHDWLGGELGEICAAIATAGDRIVQETVGTALLADLDLAEVLGD